MGLGHVAFSFCVSVGLAARSRMRVDTAPSAENELVYTARHPYYVEICALSELKKKRGFGVDLASGIGGHAVMYLNGVCRDRAAPYPILRLCPAETAAKHGVGLSVNEHYKNANWVATEGRNFFLYGALKPGERLTRAAYERTQAHAKAMGIFDGVVFHDVVFDDMSPGMSPRDHMYEVSVASDYAIGFGRNRYCARVPLDRERMAQVVGYLNGLNAQYGNNAKAFKWDLLRDNCCHVAHDALATADVWGDWPKARSTIAAAYDFPVPKNEFVNLVRRTNDLPIEDLNAVFDDRAARRALLRWDTLPTAPGALAEAEPAVQSNEIYGTDLSLIFYDVPYLGPYQRRFDRIFADRRYFRLSDNLEYFADRYRTIERNRQSLAMVLEGRGAMTRRERDELAQFYERYYRYVDRKAAEVRAALASPSNGSGAASPRGAGRSA
jgi:hypothetical protein